MPATPPTVPTFSAADYAQAMANLLPRGPIWRRDPGSNMMALMGALAPTYERSGAAAAQLIFDIFPPTTNALINEWEETLGLPDPCTPLNPSTQQRAAAVLAKFIATGGQSVGYFTGIAAALGFTITITEFKPFCADDACESPDYDPDWAYAWQVNAPQVTTFYFSADESSADDPLQTYDNTELACRIQQYAPAHTLVIFNFS